jgi:hypothetical protein
VLARLDPDHLAKNNDPSGVITVISMDTTTYSALINTSEGDTVKYRLVSTRKTDERRLKVMFICKNLNEFYAKYPTGVETFPDGSTRPSNKDFIFPDGQQYRIARRWVVD